MTAAESRRGDTLGGVPVYMTYLGSAEAFLRGADVLAEKHAQTAIPHAFLVAHTLECLLKAYVAKRLGGDKELRKDAKLRHNLQALWARAHAEGLDVAPIPPGWVSQLSQLHSDPYYLRYSTGVNAIVSPGLQPMMSELQQLAVLVRSVVTGV
ncbi:hypothetical protein UC35_14950 [Ramlibacter tataouinensis]|uniref:HEPN domain-containing protein n=1 Tax=Ramlibacter tataouinensis TaxID=94132 RepID=A0A127JVL1_9BURK|nr:hypothetical protein UC35_14950 [Ramlibacter tataouinensis]